MSEGTATLYNLRTAPSGPAAVEMRGIHKSFGPVPANRDARLRVMPGEIHALVGENGAGKSTLMAILAGLITPDAGEIRMHGKPVSFHSPVDAMASGIGMVYQHFMLVPALTVAENVVLGRETRRGVLLDLARARREIAELAEQYGLAVDPTKRVSDLSVGEQQRVEILKVLWRGSEILLLDEPTAVLTPQEVDELFRMIARLTAAGKTAVVVTHKLDEVVEHSHRVTVMRRGETVAEMETKGTTATELARAMVGRDVLLTVARSAQAAGAGAAAGAPAALAVSDLRVLREDRVAAVDGITFEVRPGEILGIAGVEGNGQRELVEAIVGLRDPESGTIAIAGEPAAPLSVAERLRRGVAHIAEDRHRRGLVLDEPMAANLILGRLPEFSGFWLDRQRMQANARELAAAFDIRPPDPDLPARGFSGGNQQKIVVARELTRPGRALLVAAHPTRGVDIGAIESIHTLLLAERDRGLGVLLVSAELSEIRALADRIVVLFKGKVSGVLDGASATEEELGELMTGARRGAAKGTSA